MAFKVPMISPMTPSFPTTRMSFEVWEWNTALSTVVHKGFARKLLTDSSRLCPKLSKMRTNDVSPTVRATILGLCTPKLHPLAAVSLGMRQMGEVERSVSKRAVAFMFVDVVD